MVGKMRAPAAIPAVQWLEGKSQLVELDMELCYYKHWPLHIENEETGKIAVYWIISLVKDNPLYSEPCWIVSEFFVQFLKIM